MSQKETSLPLIGGFIAAVGAGICCAGPLILIMMGVSGSWIGSLTFFEPYRPIFILFVILLLGFAGWKVYRPVEDCNPGDACAVPQVRKRRQYIFWLTVLFAIVLVTSNYWVVLLA